MKLEAGKYYETKSGEVFGPMRTDCGGFTDSYNALWWNEKGFCDNGVDNLIRENITSLGRTYYIIGGNVYHDPAIAKLIADVTGDEVVTVREVK